MDQMGTRMRCLEAMQLNDRDLRQDLKDHIEAIDEIDTRTEILEEMQVTNQEGFRAERQELWGGIRSLPLWAQLLLWIFVLYPSVCSIIIKIYYFSSSSVQYLDKIKPIGLEEVIEECQLPEFPSNLHTEGVLRKWLVPTGPQVEVSGEQLGSFFLNASLECGQCDLLHHQRWAGGGADFTCSHSSGIARFHIALPCGGGNACTLHSDSNVQSDVQYECEINSFLHIRCPKFPTLLQPYIEMLVFLLPRWFRKCQ